MAERRAETPGWDAIVATLKKAYPDREPKHWATVVPSYLGGPDPLDAIDSYFNEVPRPHWHIIGCGLSNIWGDEPSQNGLSGWGFELTIRVLGDADVANDAKPPNWAINLLQNLARAVVQYQDPFGVNHTIDANGPIRQGSGTKLTALAFVEDPLLGKIQTPNGNVEFLQVVGLTADELDLKLDWNAQGLLDLMREKDPLLIIDLDRKSMLDDAVLAREIRQRSEREGSSNETLSSPELSWKKLLLGSDVELQLGAMCVTSLIRLLKSRVQHGGAMTIYSEKQAVALRPGNTVEMDPQGAALTVDLTPEAAEPLRQALQPRRGTYNVPALPGLKIVVAPTVIRDARSGQAIRTIG